MGSVFSGTTGPCRKLNGFFTCNVQDEHNAIILDVTIQSPEGTQEQVLETLSAAAEDGKLSEYIVKYGGPEVSVAKVGPDAPMPAASPSPTSTAATLPTPGDVDSTMPMPTTAPETATAAPTYSPVDPSTEAAVSPTPTPSGHGVSVGILTPSPTTRMAPDNDASTPSPATIAPDNVASTPSPTIATSLPTGAPTQTPYTIFIATPSATLSPTMLPMTAVPTAPTPVGTSQGASQGSVPRSTDWMEEGEGGNKGEGSDPEIENPYPTAEPIPSLAFEFERALDIGGGPGLGPGTISGGPRAADGATRSEATEGQGITSPQAAPSPNAEGEDSPSQSVLIWIYIAAGVMAVVAVVAGYLIYRRSKQAEARVYMVSGCCACRYTGILSMCRVKGREVQQVGLRIRR
mmetsp:Transcript_38779/g.109663  ORF Transcript_38779/g.109663 Transcript_38779/m.109663 type:complete len:404 (-) Transcript_38779:851-2062(-)